MDQYWSVVGQEPGRTAEGDRQVSEGNSIGCSPSLPMAHITAWASPPLPPPSVEKLSSTKPVPGAKNLGAAILHSLSRNECYSNFTDEEIISPQRLRYLLKVPNRISDLKSLESSGLE